MTVNLEFFDDPGEFLSWTREMYEADEGRYTLMLGLAMRLQKEPSSLPEKPLMAVVREDEGSLLASMLMTPPHYLLVHNDPVDIGVLELLAEGLSERGYELPGVNGAAEASDAFTRIWSLKTGKNAILEHDFRAYTLSAVVWSTKPEGAMRLAVDKDIPVTLEMINAMQSETDSGNNVPWTEAKMAGAVAAGSVFVWDVNGSALTMAMTTRPTKRCMSISGVYTPPELRRRGYATALVATLSQWVLEQGYSMVNLFTDLANPISNSIYQKIGYKPVCDFHQYRFA